MNNVIVYKGKVTIKHIKNGKEVKKIVTHNTGCINLFEFISNCLTGNYSKVDLPRYLVGYYLESGEVSETNLGVKVFTEGIITNDSSVTSDSDSSTANIKFIIPSQIINLTNGQKVNVIALYSQAKLYTSDMSGNTEPSAYIKLKQSDEIESSDLGINNNYIIIWELTVSNKEQSEV